MVKNASNILGGMLCAGARQTVRTSVARNAATSSAVTLVSTEPRVRSFSSSASAQAKPRSQRSRDDPLALDKMGEFKYDDLTTFGHAKLQRQRELLHYARLVEWELPKLAQFQKPFAPPEAAQILRLRSIHYQGEAHPVTRKCVLTVNVRDLFASGKIASPAARRKLLLLAGVRWNPWKEYNSKSRQNLDVYAEQSEIERIALDSGVGSIKVSCERFPVERMNVKWCSDVIDSLIKEANTDAEAVQDVPLDLRHVKAKEEAEKGFSRHYAPSIRNFPKHWLPSAQKPDQSS